MVEVEKLKDNFFLLKGGSGNTAVFVQANGITVVDTNFQGGASRFSSRSRS